MDLGSIMTVLNFLALLLFGISDIRKRRAEAKAKDAESHKIDTDAADRITESALKMLEPKDKQIEQQNDQISRLLEENKQLSIKFNKLQGEFDILRNLFLEKETHNNKLVFRMNCLESKLKSLNGDYEDCK